MDRNILFRSRSIIKYENLTPYQGEEMKPLIRHTLILESPSEVFHAFSGVILERDMALGIFASLDSRQRVQRILVGNGVVPEQIEVVWDDAFRDFLQVSDIIYLHTHDENNVAYIEGIGPIDGELRLQLFPTEYDMEFAQVLDTMKGVPYTVRHYMMGQMGCVQYWPLDDAAVFTTHVSTVKHRVFEQQLEYYLSLWR